VSLLAHSGRVPARLRCAPPAPPGAVRCGYAFTLAFATLAAVGSLITGGN
jgi:hypothetical protein